MLIVRYIKSKEKDTTYYKYQGFIGLKNKKFIKEKNKIQILKYRDF